MFLRQKNEVFQPSQKYLAFEKLLFAFFHFSLFLFLNAVKFYGHLGSFIGSCLSISQLLNDLSFNVSFYPLFFFFVKLTSALSSE